MGSRPEYEEAKEIDELDAKSRGRKLLAISLIWKVYERAPSGEGAVHVETIYDLHAIIDRTSGRRAVLEDARLQRADPQDDVVVEFLALAAEAEKIPLAYSVSREQLALIRDEEHRVIAAFGGEGGGKTQALSLWLIRSWVRLGGRGVELWWIAPTIPQAWKICVKKMILGEDAEAPLVPAELVLRYPTTDRARDMAIVWIDHTTLALQYADARRKGGNLKGVRPRAIGVDEACELRDLKIWRLIRGRANKRGGFSCQIFLASTPEDGHWAYTEIVAPVDAGLRPRYHYATLTGHHNPWMSVRELEQALADKGGAESPQAQREVLGLWVSSAGRAYYRFEPRAAVREFVELAELGLEDVTATLTRERFDRMITKDTSLGVVAGQDFNIGFTYTTIAKFGVPKGSTQWGEADLVMVVVDEVITRRKGYEEHGYAIAHRFGQIAIACDSTGAQTAGTDVSDKESATHRRRLARAGHVVAPCYRSAKGEPINPPQSDSLAQVNEIAGQTVPVRIAGRDVELPRVIVHLRCKEMIASLQRVKTDGNDKIQKTPGEEDDRETAAGDTLRYLAAKMLPDTLRARERANAKTHAAQ